MLKRYSAVLLVLILFFTSCAADEDMRAGEWDGNTFTNEWADISVTFTPDFNKVREEHFSTFTEAEQLEGEEILIEFAVNEQGSPASQLMLMYVKKSDTVDTEQKLLEALTNVTIYTDYGHEAWTTETEERVIAGNEYQGAGFVLEIPHNADIDSYHDYFVRGKGDAFIVFIVSYHDDNGKEFIYSRLDSVERAGI